MAHHAQNAIPNITHIPLPVVIIGAGPVGLAAAAHALEEGLEPIVFEAGKTVADSINDWGHVRLFSPWRFNINAAARRLLETNGWSQPDPDDLPTGHELVSRYLQPLAEHPLIAGRLKLNARVVSVTRQGRDKVISQGRTDHPFLVRVHLADGTQLDVEAAAVIDASGTWKTPNPIGDGGIEAMGEAAARDHIHYGIPDVLGRAKHRYSGRTTLVVGAGHSAANALLDLAALAEDDPATKIVWAVRGNNLARVFGGGDNDQLPARGALGDRLKALTERGALTLITNFSVTKFSTAAHPRLTVTGGTPSGERHLTDIDEVIAATGQRPDLDMIREVRTDLNSALESVRDLAPLIDPNVHSCGTIRPHGARELTQPEPGFFIVGMKSYGRAPTFLMTTGYEQVRSIFAALVGDHTRANTVQLALPETGVCSSSIPGVVCCEGGKDTPINEFADPPEPAAPAAAPETANAANCGCGC
ncbi:NAD(P)-binding domain-containing protein [Magnetovibrio sp.]|uniref:NAD(P)-binding domain-containing protein n=1 Tax=Magnetovibrio sp. TaxID=2024836 RepID=UPI002F931CDB